MIVVRNVFRLKFGQAKPAVALWQDGLELIQRGGFSGSCRVLTDLVGPSYTLVFEHTSESLATWEKEAPSVMGTEEWKQWYDKFIPLVESGYREVFTVRE